MKITKEYLNTVGFFFLYLIVVIWFVVKDMPLYMTLTLTVCYIVSFIYRVKRLREVKEN